MQTSEIVFCLSGYIIDRRGRDYTQCVLAYLFNPISMLRVLGCLLGLSLPGNRGKVELITASRWRAGGRSSIIEHDGFLGNFNNNVYHHETAEPKSLTLSWTKHEVVLKSLI